MTPENRQRIIQSLNQHAAEGVFVVTGGGSLLLSDLLTVAGASSTLLEASVPYAPEALADLLCQAPQQACSEATACLMAMQALQRACALKMAATSSSSIDSLFGLGLSASLASNRPKRGVHRVHIALQTFTKTTHGTLELDKGERSRLEEERLVADLALSFLSYGLQLGVSEPAQAPEILHLDEAAAQPAWQSLLMHLLQGKRGGVHAQGSEARPKLLFPGAFHPLHSAHRAMAQRAAEIYRQPPAFELCINNVDKPPLDYIDIEHRLQQFSAEDNVWLSSYPTFLEKSRAFPGVVFLVGVDTLERIDQPHYYQPWKSQNGSADGEELRDQALAEIASLGCRFLVFGRDSDSGLQTLEDLDLSPALSALCDSAGNFHHNISSSSLRKRSNRPGSKRQ